LVEHWSGPRTKRPRLAAARARACPEKRAHRMHPIDAVVLPEAVGVAAEKLLGRENGEEDQYHPVHSIIVSYRRECASALSCS